MESKLAKYLVALSLFLLSAWDGFATAVATTVGYGEELNPVMKYFLGLGVMPFLLVKMGLTLIACLIIMKAWHKPGLRYSSVFVLGVFTTMGIIHLGYLRHVLQ